MQKFTSKNKGFTLVETLVAIAVLMISIAGPLVVASKSLSAATYAKNQSIAMFLAQESMEIVRNVKDDIILDDPSQFATLFNASNFGQCTANDPCSIDLLENATLTYEYGKCSVNAANPCLLYSDSSSDFGYHYISGGNNKATPFTRYFYVSQINPDEYQVSVVVTWYEIGVPNQITFSTNMTDVSI